VKGCNALSTLSLGKATPYFDINEDVGICDKHWEKLCKERDKLERKIKRYPVKWKVKENE